MRRQEQEEERGGRRNDEGGGWREERAGRERVDKGREVAGEWGRGFTCGVPEVGQVFDEPGQQHRGPVFIVWKLGRVPLGQVAERLRNIRNINK
jgi:hypothetical protein